MQIGEAYTLLWYSVLMILFAFCSVVAWFEIRENKEQLFDSCDACDGEIV